jgi:hypothetical protein
MADDCYAQTAAPLDDPEPAPELTLEYDDHTSDDIVDEP